MGHTHLDAVLLLLLDYYSNVLGLLRTIILQQKLASTKAPWIVTSSHWRLSLLLSAQMTADPLVRNKLRKQ